MAFNRLDLKYLGSIIYQAASDYLTKQAYRNVQMRHLQLDRLQMQKQRVAMQAEMSDQEIDMVGQDMANNELLAPIQHEMIELGYHMNTFNEKKPMRFLTQHTLKLLDELEQMDLLQQYQIGNPTSSFVARYSEIICELSQHHQQVVYPSLKKTLPPPPPKQKSPQVQRIEAKFKLKDQLKALSETWELFNFEIQHIRSEMNRHKLVVMIEHPSGCEICNQLIARLIKCQNAQQKTNQRISACKMKRDQLERPAKLRKIFFNHCRQTPNKSPLMLKKCLQIVGLLEGGNLSAQRAYKMIEQGYWHYL